MVYLALRHTRVDNKPLLVAFHSTFDLHNSFVAIPEHVSVETNSARAINGRAGPRLYLQGNSPTDFVLSCINICYMHASRSNFVISLDPSHRGQWCRKIVSKFPKGVVCDYDQGRIDAGIVCSSHGSL